MSPTRRPSSVSGLRRAVQGTPAAPAPAAAAPLPPRPEKPVRFTLDLDRAHHRFLKEYALSIDTDASRVMRALLDQLRDDPALADQVRNRIWESRQQ